MPILVTSGDPHHWRWPHPMWKSPHHPAIRKGEDATATPPVPSRNHQSPVVCSWMCLLARHKQGQRRSSSAMWDLHPVPGPKCCSTPHSNANSVLPMADVHHGHLYFRRNWLPNPKTQLFAHGCVFWPGINKAIILPSERERMLQQLHQFHQGTTKAQLFTCGCVFWPGINKAKEEAVQQCETCTQL